MFKGRENLRRQTTAGTNKGDFDRDSDADQEIKDELEKIVEEHSNSKSFKLGDDPSSSG